MSNDKIQRELTQVLTEQLGIELPSPDTDLIETGLLDSLSFVEMLFEIEQRFGVSVEIETLELDDLRSLEKIGRFVAERCT